MSCSIKVFVYEELNLTNYMEKNDTLFERDCSEAYLLQNKYAWAKMLQLHKFVIGIRSKTKCACEH